MTDLPPDDVKPNADGMISFSVHQQALQDQKEMHEEKYNDMQSCLTSEIQRLTEALEIQGIIIPTIPPAVYDDQSAVVEGEVEEPWVPEDDEEKKEPVKKTPAKNKNKRKSTPSSSDGKPKKKRIRKPTPKKLGPSANEFRWMQRYQELIQYQETHGHLNLTRENPKLYIWVTTQRSEHRFLREGKTSQITPERIQLLDKVKCWQWTAIKHKAVSWNTRYQQLLEYQIKHGHTNVPQYCKESPPGLGNFVMEQRRMHKVYTTGIGDKKLIEEKMVERTAKLDAIGFVWSLRNRGGWWNNEHHDHGDIGDIGDIGDANNLDHDHTRNFDHRVQVLL